MQESKVPALLRWRTESGLLSKEKSWATQD